MGARLVENAERGAQSRQRHHAFPAGDTHTTQPVPDTDAIQCPVCGWTGQADRLEEATGDDECPVCGESIQ